MLYALSAALCWGLADFAGAVGARRVGLLLTVVIGQGCAVAVLLAVWATPAGATGHPSAATMLALVASGLLAAIALLSFYRGLQLGPLALVSPIFAAYAALTVLLAVVFDDEVLSTLASLGVVTTIAGVVLASAQRKASERPARPLTGVPYAIGAMVAWALAAYIIGVSSHRVGWLLPVLVNRVVSLAVLAGVAGVVALRGRLGSVPLKLLPIPVLSGLFDILALLAFARGSQLGLVALMAAASATFPLVLVAGGVLVYHERPSNPQWAGVGLAITGLLVLGLAR